MTRRCPRSRLPQDRARHPSVTATSRKPARATTSRPVSHRGVNAVNKLEVALTGAKCSPVGGREHTASRGEPEASSLCLCHASPDRRHTAGRHGRPGRRTEPGPVFRIPAAALQKRMSSAAKVRGRRLLSPLPGRISEHGRVLPPERREMVAKCARRSAVAARYGRAQPRAHRLALYRIKRVRSDAGVPVIGAPGPVHPCHQSGGQQTRKTIRPWPFSGRARLT